MIGHHLDDPVYLVVLIALFVASISLHEFGHAITAHLLGDPTPSEQGRVTVNPASHLDPLGTVFLLLAGFGWAKPVQVNTSLLRWPRFGNFLVSAAGPFTNLVLALAAAAALKYGGNWSTGAQLWFAVAFQLNLMLMIFNLLPIPPLDGGHLVEAILPRAWVPAWERLLPYGMVLLLLIVFWPFGGSPMGGIIRDAGTFILNTI